MDKYISQVPRYNPHYVFENKKNRLTVSQVQEFKPSKKYKLNFASEKVSVYSAEKLSSMRIQKLKKEEEKL